jgi:alpha-D-ribose 1-methylphosphonate 5-triphosphate synthase subunit PhnH
MPQQTPTEALHHATFQALMWALSHPGRPQQLPSRGHTAYVSIAETLIDLETSFFTPDALLREQLLHTRAQFLPPSSARYQFYPFLDDSALMLISDAPTGNYANPDESATLVLGAGFGTGTRLRLSGPGVNGVTTIRIDGVLPLFWDIRTRLVRYPLGWDVLFVADQQVIGLPRTTHVEVLS